LTKINNFNTKQVEKAVETDGPLAVLPPPPVANPEKPSPVMDAILRLNASLNADITKLRAEMATERTAQAKAEADLRAELQIAKDKLASEKAKHQETLAKMARIEGKLEILEQMARTERDRVNASFKFGRRMSAGDAEDHQAQSQPADQ